MGLNGGMGDFVREDEYSTHREKRRRIPSLYRSRHRYTELGIVSYRIDYQTPKKRLRIP